MLQTVEKQERTSNFTGLSLVLFLFLSALSMMAAYEASRASDDIRKNIVASLQEYSPQSADADHEGRTLFAAADRVEQLHFPISYLPPAHGAAAVVPFLRTFDARGPPTAPLTAS